MEKQPDITFEVIKCEEGLYVSKRHREYHHLIYFTNERFNQKENVVLSTWKDNWYLLKGEFEISSYRPCELTSKQTYRIIRHHVKENINHNYGVITSDYDFCFTVMKRIPIKPYVISSEIKRDNGKSYRPPRFKHHEKKYNTWELFEMTNSEDRYKGYTVIPGFKGDSLADLYDNIKTFLDDLMNHINAPIIECEHCNGYGHIKEEIKKEKT